MKGFARILLASLIMVVPTVFLLAPSTVDAGLIDNAKSPFTDQSDPGAADNVAVIGTDTQKKDGIVNIVRGLVNWVLGIMGLIALIFLMYGGFLMVTSAGDEEKYKKGFTILRHAAIGLILIGVAWFIASLIFWLINQTGRAAGPACTNC